MTLTDYVQIVMNEVDDNSSEAQAVITNGIKEVYQDIMRRCSRYLIPSTTEDQTATIGTATYTPASFTDILAVHYKTTGDFDRLESSDQDYYFDHINDENSTPKKFFINGNGVQLVPAPDYAGTIRFTFVPVVDELTGTSLIPDRFADVVKNGGCYKYYAYDNNPSAVEYERYFFRGLDEMHKELSTRQTLTRPKLFKCHS